MTVGRRHAQASGGELAAMEQWELFDGPMELPIEPCDPGVRPGDRPRLSRQCEEILDALRGGPKLNVELAAISLKYSGRISDCRAAGYVIVAEHMDGGLWKYTLRE